MLQGDLSSGFNPFAPARSAPLVPAAPTGDETLRPDDAADVLKELLCAQNRSFVLGLNLKLPPAEVESIYSIYSNPCDRLLHVIIAFLKQVQPRPTWRVIVDALRSPVVDLPALAKRVEAVHFPDPTSTHDAVPQTTTDAPDGMSEQSRRDYEEALKEGEDDVAYTRVMFLGKEGSGKTSVFDGLMGRPFKEGRDSTTLAEPRDVRYEWVEAEGVEGGGVWRERSKEDELNELAIRSRRVVSKSQSNSQNQASSKDMATPSEVEAISKAYRENTDEICAKATELGEHMYSKESPHVLHVWDCGGQPIFLDILSVFITIRTFFLLVFNAADNMHTPCGGSKWRYQGKTIPGRKRNVSVMQLLVQWMQLIYATVCSSSNKPNTMLVGTHGDKLKEQSTNEGVLKSFDSAYDRKFYTIVLKRLIIDNTTAGKKQDEDRGYCVIREEVSEFSKAFTKRTPLTWISFRRVIMKEIKEMGGNVFKLPKSKVDEIGKSCNIHNVDSVLEFYHQLGVFLYFREACPDTVFIDPHWLFQNICVLLVPECYDESKLYVPHSALKACLDNCGIMSNDIYQEASQKCELKADDLIQILDHFDLAKEMPADEVKDALRSITGSNFFFVPCTLKNMLDQKQKPARVQAATLHIIFKNLGCVPPGFFIRLAALMARREKFQLHLKSDRGIYRDYIPFKYNEILEVTIFEPPSIDSVHVDVAIHKRWEHTLPKSCLSLHSELYKLCEETCGRWLPSVDVGLAFKCEECFKENKERFLSADECSVCESCTCPVSDTKEYSCWFPPTDREVPAPKSICLHSGPHIVLLNSLESIIETIKATPSAKETLSIKFKTLMWIGTNADCSESDLVLCALKRVQQDPNQFQVFLGMLRDTPGMDIIADKLST